MPLDLREPCPEPGIDENALVALVQHRGALAGCRQKHRDAVSFYDDVKLGLEGG